MAKYEISFGVSWTFTKEVELDDCEDLGITTCLDEQCWRVKRDLAQELKIKIDKFFENGTSLGGLISDFRIRKVE